jgi:4-amino-4-deoxy-L-arabinose transferase-like glycosyltransferase
VLISVPSERDIRVAKSSLQELHHDSSAVGWRCRQCILIAVILAGAALRLHQLGYYSLWVDEIVTQTLAKQPLPAMVRVLGQYSDHPPLIYLVSYGVVRTLGDSDFAARLLAASAGIPAVPALYALGKRLWNTDVGLMAALLVAFWPTHLRYSQEARHYALLTLLTAVSMYWLYRGVHDVRKVRTWAAYSVGMILALYTHYSAFLLLAAEGVFMVIVSVAACVRPGRSRRMAEFGRRMLPFGLSCLACAVAYLPWWGSFSAQMTRLVGDVSPTSGGSSLAQIADIGQRTSRFLAANRSVLLVVIVILMSVGSVLSWRRREWDQLLLLLTTLLVPLAVLGSLQSSHFYHPRYLLWLVVPGLLLTARGLEGLLKGGARLLRPAPHSRAQGMVLAAVILTGALFPFDLAYYRMHKEDWRGVSAYLTVVGHPGDVILVDGSLRGSGGDAARTEQGLTYYVHAPLAIIRAEYGAVDHLPSDLNSRATARGVIWHQGPLRDASGLTDLLVLKEFYNVTVLELRNPTGIVWKDAASILGAMLDLQPDEATHGDLHLALAQLYVRVGAGDQAAEHLGAAAAAMPRNDQQFQADLTAILKQLRK